MKKALFAFMAISVIALCMITPVGGVASLALIPIFGGRSMSAQELDSYARNLSNYEGEEEGLYSFEGEDFYTGSDDDLLDFGGPVSGGFALEAQHPRTYVMNITNANLSTETVFLTPGLGWDETNITNVAYDPGDPMAIPPVPISVKTSRMPGVPHGNSFLSVAGNTLSLATSPKEIKWFYSFIKQNPTSCCMLKISSNNSTSQIEQQLVIREQSPFRDLETNPIPMSQFITPQDYKDKMVIIPTPNLVLSGQTQIELPIMASSTCTITFFLGGVLNTATAMKYKKGKAQATIAAVGGIKNIQRAVAVKQRSMQGGARQKFLGR